MTGSVRAHDAVISPAVDLAVASNKADTTEGEAEREEEEEEE